MALFVLLVFSCNNYDRKCPNKLYENYTSEQLEGLRFWGVDSSGKDYKNNKIEASGSTVVYKQPKCLCICDKYLPNIGCNKQSTKKTIIKAKYGKVLDTICNMISRLLNNITKDAKCGELLNGQKELICSFGNSLKENDEDQILLKNGPVIFCDYWFNLGLRNSEPKKSYDKKFNFNEYFKKLMDSPSEWEKFINKIHCLLNSALVKHPKDILVKICQKNNKNELAEKIKSNNIIKNCLDGLQKMMLKNKGPFHNAIFGKIRKQYFTNFLKFINNCISCIVKNIASFKPLIEDLKRLTSAYLKVDPTGLAFKAMLTFVHNQKSFVVGRIDDSIKNVKNKFIMKNLSVDYNDLVGVGCLGMRIIMNCGIGLKNKKKVSFAIGLFKAYVKLLKHFIVNILGTGDVDKIISCLS